jgi:hypothetical protein
VRKELKTTERLFRIAPEVNRYPAARALRRSGITSAKAIREMGQSAFVFDQWLKVASPLRDKLRIQQRNALVSYTNFLKSGYR